MTGCTTPVSTAPTSLRWRLCCQSTTSTSPVRSCIAVCPTMRQSELLCSQTPSTVATGIPPTGTRCHGLLQGPERAALLSRGHWVLLFNDRAALWREPLHAPCSQPLDRDAACSDRPYAGWDFRVLSAAQGSLSQGSELVGPRTIGSYRVGSSATPRI